MKSLTNFPSSVTDSSVRPVLTDDLSLWFLVNEVLKAELDVHSKPYWSGCFFVWYGISGSGGVSAKGKRKPRQEEDEDYREFPQKKHKLYGKGVTLLILFLWEPELYPLRVEGRGTLDFDPLSTVESFELFGKEWPLSCFVLTLCFCHGLAESVGWGSGTQCVEKWREEILLVERG